ncbi:MAG: type I-E CRISPR-associated protein Cas5/CasD [Deltaproteobacteria bacterium]|nr:type I-E CRISPR-associated protein Cas5/CasD [Deltaproteobacteria bacterium]
MHNCLVFQLYGPLCSWGTVAVGEVRPTDSQPTKSAVTGLVAAALGIRRDEEERQRRLVQGYGMAVRTDLPGTLVRDFHTAEVPSATSLKGSPHRTRRDELLVLRPSDNPVISYREYRCDALHTVALWERPDAPHPLGEIAAALERPRFTLYLGRKSCPSALPLRPEQFSGNTLHEVFAQYLAQLSQQYEELKLFPTSFLKANRQVFWQWDDDWGGADFSRFMEVVRRDVSLSRRRWQFAERRERQWTEALNPQPEVDDARKS